jgi:hypothetical protein
LPRNPAVASTDLVDRVTRGSHTGAPQAQAAAVKETATQNLADDIKNGVPVYKAPAGTAFPKGYNFSNTLNTAIQGGNYDDAIKGLQGQLAVMNTPGPEHIPPSAKQAVQDHISQLQVFKDTGADAKFVDTYSTTTNAQWRALGNPTSSSYNPALYQKLYTLDQALTNKGVSGGSITSAGHSEVPKFSLPATSSGSSRGSSAAANRAVALVKSNTVGSIPTVARENFVNNLLQPAPSLNLPEAKLTQPDTLIKAHRIAVGMPKA